MINPGSYGPAASGPNPWLSNQRAGPGQANKRPFQNRPSSKDQKRRRVGAAPSSKIVVSPDAMPEFKEIMENLKCKICHVELSSPAIVVTHFNGQRHRRQWQAYNNNKPPLPVAVLRNGVYNTSNVHDMEMARVNAIDEAKFLKGVDAAALRADPDAKQLLERRHCNLCWVYFSSATEIRGHLTSPKHLANTQQAPEDASGGVHDGSAFSKPKFNDRQHPAEQSNSEAKPSPAAADRSQTVFKRTPAPGTYTSLNAGSGSAESNPKFVHHLPSNNAHSHGNGGPVASSSSSWQQSAMVPEQQPIVCGSCNVQIRTLAEAQLHYESAEHLKTATAAAAASASAAAAVAAAAAAAAAAASVGSQAPPPVQRFGGPLPPPPPPPQQQQQQHQPQPPAQLNSSSASASLLIESDNYYHCKVCDFIVDNAPEFHLHKKNRDHKNRFYSELARLGNIQHRMQHHHHHQQQQHPMSQNYQQQPQSFQHYQQPMQSQSYSFQFQQYQPQNAQPRQQDRRKFAKFSSHVDRNYHQSF